MTKNKLQKLSSLGVAAVVLGTVLAPVGVSAVATGADKSDSSTVEATVNSVISITSGHSVSFQITPKSGGAVSSASDSLTVDTNSSSGYTLSLKADQDLTSGSDSFNPASGSIETGATLAEGEWGFAAVKSVGSHVTGDFSSSYSARSSIATASVTEKWAAVPLVTDMPFKTTTAEANGDSTTVWFAANAGMSQPTGVYSAVVTYTATTNVGA